MEEKKEVITEEQTEEIIVTEKKGFKQWCKEHPDIVLTFFGGVCTLAGGILKLVAMKSEYEDNVYTTIDDDVYKIPARKMKTAKRVSAKR